MKVLLTGCSGYVGSSLALGLLEQGHEVIGIDLVPSSQKIKNLVFVHHDIRLPLSGNEELREATKGVEVVFHAAALAYVGESFERPSDYALTNVVGTQNVLNWMLDQGVRALVFTSSCSVLKGSKSPIKEGEGFSPISPYAATKLSNEKQIELWARACGGSYGVARFFNVAGVYRGLVGDQHDPEPHLIPRVVASISSGAEIVVNGNDFKTSDGSAIRDYVHIEDLVDGLLSLMRLCHAGRSGAFNLGSGKGHSVLEVVRSAERVIGEVAKITFGPRRPGDAPQLVADISAARSVLGFNPTRSDLVSMLREQLNLR